MAGKDRQHSNNDNLMLVVRHVRHGTFLDCSVISLQNNSFKVLGQDDDDDIGILRNLSRLKADNYDALIGNTCYRVHATCNSWMLMTYWHLGFSYDFLLNPTTGEWKCLPYFALACPTLSDHWAYGLGFDPAGDTYKVLRCRSTDTHEPCEKLYVELLSSSASAGDSWSWKQISCPHDPFIAPDQRPSLFINGFYYWPTTRGILSFDFTEERFGTALIPMPKSDGRYCVVEYHESLAAVVFEYPRWLTDKLLKRDVTIGAAAEKKPFIFEIWEWKEASMWSSVFTGEIPASDASVEGVLGLCKNRKLLLMSSCGDLLVYDIEERRLENNLGIRDEGMAPEVFSFVPNAKSSFKSSSRNSSATSIRALTRCLKPSDSLMLLVQRVLDSTRDYFVISTENNSFKVLHQGHGDDNGLLPNLSRLRAENYNLFCMNAKYHVLASCDTWMLWNNTENPADLKPLLWDPRTDVLVTLPFFDVEPRMPGLISAYMWGYGIGFDPYAPENYKVVRCRSFKYFRSNDEAHAEVFSHETWKKIPYPHDPLWQVYQSPSLFVDGFYYWIAHHYTQGNHAIISFDFAKEEFPLALIPMPCSKILRDIKLGCVCLAEFCGSLAAIVYDFHGQAKKSMKNIYCYPGQEMKKKENNVPFTFEIWVWKHGVWSHVSTYKVPLTLTRVVYRGVIGLYKNVKVFLWDSEGYLWLYDVETRDLENLGIRDDCSSLTIFPYV
ncbi:F-box family protein [Striga asiatica]|uniref:F-box family protein n=1 Tax=Striga asiatica TaxID=4170 RepID=A0A5A7PZP8_STRAF|nr:F-box family protein [Striga asiatica]